jgi:hypothetical protein
MKPEERKTARRLREEGRSLREIAARLGVALSTASLWTRDVVRPVVAPAPETPPADAGKTRRCSKCRRELPIGAFNRHASGLQWWCRECFGRYYRDGAVQHRRRANELKARRVAEARAFILDLLRRTPCADCGEDDIVVLEFDHVGEKRAHVSTLVSRGVRLSRLEAEVERCEVVCANCHRRRTAQRGGWRRLDGDLSCVRWRSPRHERNVRHVFEALATSGCVDCGEEDMCVLDFDHRGSKTGVVMRLARNEVSLARLSAEIASCEVRCANCHRRRTATEAAYFRTREDDEEVPPARIELALQP